jgi:hypothetical protein
MSWWKWLLYCAIGLLMWWGICETYGALTRVSIWDLVR